MATKKKIQKPKLIKKPKTKTPLDRFAILVSQFNPEVTHGLLSGAVWYLAEMGIHQDPEDIYAAPGAFEIPLLAQKLARTKRYQGVICLGCVIKGDTAHFEFISLGATMGIMQATLETEVPITFGILTTYTDEQARVRSLEDSENKGREAAAACYQSARLLRTLS